MHNNILSYALDKQAQAFLSQHYQIPIISCSDLEIFISIWNYESLIKSICHAQENSLAYKKQLSSISCQQLLQEAHGKLATILAENITATHLAAANIVTTNLTATNLVSTNQNAKTPMLDVHAIRLLCKQLLEALPCTTGADIVAHSDAFLAVRHDDVHGVTSIETSGTTTRSQNISEKTLSNQVISSSKRVYCSASDLQGTIDFFLYGMQYLLQKDGNRVALLMSSMRQGSIGHLLKEAMDILGVECIVLGFSTDMEAVMESLLEYKPTCIVGIPWHVLSLSYQAKNSKLKDTLDSVLLSGDVLTGSMRQHIEENLSCEVFVHYGLTETGLGGAVECRQHAGLHMRQLDLYVEILDKNLQSVPNGTMGEIVITTLTRQAMPLIRYRTGDAGRLINGMCECGSVLQRLEVQGRIHQCILLHDKSSVHISNFQDFFYEYSGLTDFELCVFTDEIYGQSFLLVGVDFESASTFDYIDTSDTALECVRKNRINMLEENFAKFYNLIKIHKEDRSKMTLKENQNAGIISFSICTMDAYKNIVGQNTHADTFVTNASVSFSLKHVANISSKKCIHYIKGSLSQIYA